MKKYKIIPYISGIAIYIVIAILFSGYGNMKNHPSINEYIVEAFNQKYNKGKLSIDKFKNYMFVFEHEKLSGDAVTKPGLFHPNYPPVDLALARSYSEEGTRDMNPLDWIKHGGYSADEPEAPASLRHFYDPTQPEGSRYLNDKVNAKLLGFIQSIVSNPLIDDVEWALGSENPKLGLEQHTYTWINGKKWLSEALKEADPAKRKKLMAKAWRALGETLHMIADHGCPSHVRNDGHPSPMFNYNDYIGNPDPYEEYMAIIGDGSQANFDEFKNGTCDASLAAKLSKANTAKEIADLIAVFTNANFFTTETISGTDWKGNEVKQITHPHWVYLSPKLQNMEYRDYCYFGKVAGQDVMHCTDLWYYKKVIPYRSFPYVDFESVKSQARVLIPTIIEAGKELMRVFIPALKVEITEAKTGKSLKGKITHTKDDEYKNQIVYNGNVKIKRYGSNFKEKEVSDIQAKDGVFEKTNIVAEPGDFFVAEIEFGGVYVKSDDIKPDEQTYTFTRANISIKLEGTLENITSGVTIPNQSISAGNGNDFGIKPIANPVSWSGNSFSVGASHTWKNTSATENSNSNQSMSGSIKLVNGKKFISGSVTCTYTNSNNSVDVYGRKVIIRKVGSYAYSFNEIPDATGWATDLIYFSWDSGTPLTQANAQFSKYEETTTTEIIDTGEKTSSTVRMKSIDYTKYGYVHVKFDL